MVFVGKDVHSECLLAGVNYEYRSIRINRYKNCVQKTEYSSIVQKYWI